jgi:dTDP-4-amino-4,6-dideoxygalactose transaminase
MGDGGAVVTNDADIAESVRMLRNYGQRDKYHHDLIGFNRRLDTIQAAVLAVKLEHLDEWNARRRLLAGLYLDELRDVAGIELPPRDDPGAVESVWHLFVVQADQRDRLREHLARRGVSTGIHYPIPVHLQPAYSKLGYTPGRFPLAESLAQRALSLPMYPELSEADVEYVASAIRDFDARPHRL